MRRDRAPSPPLHPRARLLREVTEEALTMDRAFSFVDLAGFSALTEAHGDEVGADLVERFVAIVASVLEDDGEIVSTIGDAVFIVSPEPKNALQVLSRLWARLETERDFPAVRA